MEERAVISPECANGVMVGMGIRTHKAHGHIGVAGALNLPTGKYSRAAGINQKRQKHGWRILLTAGAPMIDLSHGCIHRLDGIDHEMDEMIAWDPVLHVTQGDETTEDDRWKGRATTRFRLACGNKRPALARNSRAYFESKAKGRGQNLFTPRAYRRITTTHTHWSQRLRRLIGCPDTDQQRPSATKDFEAKRIVAQLRFLLLTGQKESHRLRETKSESAISETGGN
jgi:hypothetical protein